MDFIKKNKKVLLTITAVIVLVGFTVAIMLIFSRAKNTEEETEVPRATTGQITLQTTELVTEAVTEEITEELTEVQTATIDEPVTEEETTTETAKKTTSDPSKYFREDIEDKEKPLLLISSASVDIVKGEAFDIHKYIGYADDADRDVELKITGEVDTNTVGSYDISYSLKDDVGNETTGNMKVNVVASAPPASGEAPQRTPFSDFKTKYGGDNVSLGIDVSRWDGNIDFQKVKDAGCDFVIMRLGGYDDGELYTDRCYLQNIKNAKDAGLKIGIYWHAEESSYDEVKASVKYLLDVLDGEKLDFPIAYDWEDFGNFESYGMNLQDINDCYHVFEEELGAAGYDVCLYSSKNFLLNTWKDRGDTMVWLAHYTSNTDFTGDYFMWQQTSTGGMDGIDHNVDFNVLYNNQNN